MTTNTHLDDLAGFSQGVELPVFFLEREEFREKGRKKVEKEIVFFFFLFRIRP